MPVFKHHLETNICLASFLLVCLCLVCLSTFYNKLVVQQVLRPRIHLFAAGRVEAFFSHVAPSYCALFWYHLTVKSRIITSVTGRPVKFSATLHTSTAIGLGRSLTTVIQIEHTSGPEALCHRICPLRFTTCWSVDSGILAWPLIQPGEHVQAGMLPFHEDARDSAPACVRYYSRLCASWTSTPTLAT